MFRELNDTVATLCVGEAEAIRAGAEEAFGDRSAIATVVGILVPIVTGFVDLEDAVATRDAGAASKVLAAAPASCRATGSGIVAVARTPRAHGIHGGTTATAALGPRTSVGSGARTNADVANLLVAVSVSGRVAVPITRDIAVSVSADVAVPPSGGIARLSTGDGEEGQTDKKESKARRNAHDERQRTRLFDEDQRHHACLRQSWLSIVDETVDYQREGAGIVGVMRRLAARFGCVLLLWSGQLLAQPADGHERGGESVDISTVRSSTLWHYCSTARDVRRVRIGQGAMLSLVGAGTVGGALALREPGFAKSYMLLSGAAALSLGPLRLLLSSAPEEILPRSSEATCHDRVIDEEALLVRWGQEARRARTLRIAGSAIAIVIGTSNVAIGVVALVAEPPLEDDGEFVAFSFASGGGFLGLGAMLALVPSRTERGYRDMERSNVGHGPKASIRLTPSSIGAGLGVQMTGEF